MNVLSRYSPRGLQKTTINHAQYIRPPGLVLKPEPSHKEEMSASDQRHLVAVILET
jgi:hypothetical protein